MDNLEKVQKTSPDRLNKMNKTQLENLILGSLKEIGAKLNKLDNLDTNLNKLDNLDTKLNKLDNLDRIEDKLDAMEQKVNYKRIKKRR